MILLRCDASADLGAGHLVRQLSLGEALRELGEPVALLCRRLPERLRTRVRDAELDQHRIPGPPGRASDVEAVAEVAARKAAELVIVDGDWFGPGYHRKLRERIPAVGAVVDGADCALDVDLLVNPAPGAEELEHPVPADCVQLLGPDYALLRKQFRVARADPGTRGMSPATVQRVLVTLGGGETTALTAKVLRGLEAAGYTGRADVVTGPSGGTGEGLRELTASLSFEACIHGDVAPMAELMAEQHLAVSGAGGTSLELACIGVPAVLVTVAEDQRTNARELDRRAVAVHAGPIGRIEVDELARPIRTLLADADRRAAMSARGRRLVDGRGALRVAEVARRIGGRP